MIYISYRHKHKGQYFQMSYDVILVIKDGRLGRVLDGRVLAGTPHVHDCQPDACHLLRSQPVVKRTHTLLGAIQSSEPYRPSPHNVAYHNTVCLPFSDRYLINPYRLGAWNTRTSELLGHVLLVQTLYRLPVQLELPCHHLFGTLTASPPHLPGKPLRVK